MGIQTQPSRAAVQPGFSVLPGRPFIRDHLFGKSTFCLVRQKTQLDCGFWRLAVDTSARIMFFLFPFLFHTMCLFTYSIYCSYLLLLKFLSCSLYSADQIQGTVTLKNISTSTSGLYQCTSSNAIGKSTCLLNLQVVERKDTYGHRDCYYCAYVIICSRV